MKKTFAMLLALILALTSAAFATAETPKTYKVGIIQMAYNTQNLVATGCYESRDGGLSDFGHEVVAEMNRLGILCDLSHVGAQSSRDVILASRQPVA